MKSGPFHKIKKNWESDLVGTRSGNINNGPCHSMHWVLVNGKIASDTKAYKNFDETSYCQILLMICQHLDTILQCL